MASNQLRAPSMMMGFWAAGMANPSTLQLAAAATWLAFGFTSDQSKTLNAVRLFMSSVLGSLATTDLTCDLYSDTAGIPNASLESHNASSVPAGGNWVNWTGFTTVLTADTQYWLVFKNANGTPASNAPTYQWVPPAASNVEVMPRGSSSNFESSSIVFGWAKVHSLNSGTAWATNLQDAVAGPRVGYSDSTYDGMPLQNAVRPASGTSTDRATGKQEAGVKFNVPANATLNVTGVWMPLFKNSTPGALRFRIYQGSGSGVTLLATTNAIAAANIVSSGTTGDGYTAHFSSPVPLSSANNPYRVVMSDATSGDASTLGYNGMKFTYDSDSNSLALKPMNGSLSKTVATDNTASPVMFTDTAADVMAFALLLDTNGELTAVGGAGGGIKTGGMM